MDRGAWRAAVPGVAKSCIRATKHSCIYNSQISFFSEVFCRVGGFGFVLFACWEFYFVLLLVKG